MLACVSACPLAIFWENRRQVCAGLSLTETRHPAGAHLPRHCHERAYFCLIGRGTYREEYGSRQRFCRPHMLAFHPPMEVHAEHVDGEEVCSFNIENAASWLRGFPSGSQPLDQPFECNAGPAVGLAVRILDEFDGEQLISVEHSRERPMPKATAAIH